MVLFETKISAQHSQAHRLVESVAYKRHIGWPSLRHVILYPLLFEPLLTKTQN